MEYKSANGTRRKSSHRRHHDHNDVTRKDSSSEKSSFKHNRKRSRSPRDSASCNERRHRSRGRNRSRSPRSCFRRERRSGSYRDDHKHCGVMKAGNELWNNSNGSTPKAMKEYNSSNGKRKKSSHRGGHDVDGARKDSSSNKSSFKHSRKRLRSPRDSLSCNERRYRSRGRNRSRSPSCFRTERRSGSYRDDHKHRGVMKAGNELWNNSTGSMLTKPRVYSTTFSQLTSEDKERRSKNPCSTVQSSFPPNDIELEPTNKPENNDCAFDIGVEENEIINVDQVDSDTEIEVIPRPPEFYLNMMGTEHFNNQGQRANEYQPRIYDGRRGLGFAAENYIQIDEHTLTYIHADNIEIVYNELF